MPSGDDGHASEHAFAAGLIGGGCSEVGWVWCLIFGQKSACISPYLQVLRYSRKIQRAYLSVGVSWRIGNNHIPHPLVGTSFAEVLVFVGMGNIRTACMCGNSISHLLMCISYSSHACCHIIRNNSSSVVILLLPVLVSEKLRFLPVM